MKRFLFFLLLLILMLPQVIPGGVVNAQSGYRFATGILIMGEYQLHRTLKTTKYRYGCPPPSNMQFNINTSTWSYPITSITIYTPCNNYRYSYDGTPSHCLTFYGYNLAEMRLHSNTHTWAPSDPYLVEPPWDLFTAYGGNYTYLENNKLNVEIIVRQNQVQIQPQWFYQAYSLLNPTGVGQNITLQIYNSNNQLVNNLSMKLFELKTLPPLPNGKYKLKVQKDQLVASTSLCSGIEIRINLEAETEIEITDNYITNYNVLKPTDFDKIHPRSQEPEETPPGILPPELPPLPEDEQGAPTDNIFKKWLIDILRSLFSCDELTLSKFQNLYNILKTKFPFVVINDLTDLLTISDSCPNLTLTFKNRTSSMNFCNTIPQPIINFSKIVFSAVITVILFFSIINIVKKFFENV